MKNRASGLLKQIITVITEMAKSKTLALKSKTRAIKTRLIIFSLLRNKKVLMSSFSDKLRSLVNREDYKKVKVAEEEEEEEEAEDDACVDDDKSNTVVLHNAMSHESLPNPTHTQFLEEEGELQEQYGYGYGYGYDDDEDDNKYPDLTHSLFDLAELDAGGSVIDLVKKSKPQGEEFRLEDEIDQVADLFIKKFHRQMRIQKQRSMKRQMEEMLERSV